MLYCMGGLTRESKNGGCRAHPLERPPDVMIRTEDGVYPPLLKYSLRSSSPVSNDRLPTNTVDTTESTFNTSRAIHDDQLLTVTILS